MQRYLARARTPADSVERYGFDAYVFLQQLGRPAAAAAAFREAVNAIDHSGNSVPAWRHGVFQVVTMYSLFGEADSATTSEAVQWLMRQASAPPSRNPEEAEQQREDLCILTHWRLAHRDTTGVHTAIERLKNGVCYPSLRALLAAIEQSPDTGSTLRELESRRGGSDENYYQNLEIARLLEARGDVNGALKWIRRRPGYRANTMFAYPLREEGRLAAMTGDREGAIRAYRHYLALRYNPEPSVKPAVDSVRAELGRLVGEQ
jgi:tetratricopeptide (TPR) repeat protein